MGSKNHPGAYDCYQKAEPDEPMFVLLARDPLASVLVRLWADLNRQGHPPKVAEALACAADMDRWRESLNPDGSRGLDAIAFQSLARDFCTCGHHFTDHVGRLRCEGGSGCPCRDYVGLI